MKLQRPVIVIGGGWAGLAAAIELARREIPVTLLESAKQLGGRARRVQFEDISKSPKQPNQLNQKNQKYKQALSVDNGQHLLLGAYKSTLALLKLIGINEKRGLLRKNLSMTMLSKQWRPIRLRTSRLPAPLNLALGLLRTSGLSIKDRLNALKFSRELSLSDFSISTDESCLDLFNRHCLSEKLIKAIWEPLCLAGLNTHIHEASAEIFLSMLYQTFANARSDANLLFARIDLGALFPDPALDYIEKHGGSIRLGKRVTSLQIKNDSIMGVSLAESALLSNHVILATPYQAAEKLIAQHPILETLRQKLQKFEAKPICTIYLQYPKRVKLPSEMIGFISKTAQWAFDRRVCGQAGLISVVISGSGPHMDIDNAELCAQVEQELATHYPGWPKTTQRMVIREKRATFNCSININKIRPTNNSAVNGLWLAGDYTNTGLPSTLEGAVRSGIQSAKAVAKSIMQSSKM